LKHIVKNKSLNLFINTVLITICRLKSVINLQHETVKLNQADTTSALITSSSEMFASSSFDFLF